MSEFALREWAQGEVDETVDCFLRFKIDNPECFSCPNLGFCESLKAKLGELEHDRLQDLATIQSSSRSEAEVS